MSGRRGKGKRAALALGCLLVLGLAVSSASVLLRRQPPVSYRPQWEEWDGTAVFLGDSITDFCDLRLYYPGLNAVNEGISGQTTWDILERMESSVYAREPELVVVLAGVNDLFLGYGEQDVVNDLCAIAGGIHQRLPETAVLVQSVYPVGEGLDMDRTLTGSIQTVNARLEQLAEQYGFRYVDVYTALRTEEGWLDPAYADDGLHPNDAGYRAAQPVLTQALDQAIRTLDR